MKNSFKKIIGKEDGPTSIILAGVHGNERCGIEALEKILPSLKIENGILFIGYGNPKAIKQNVRFTETNLNRLFKPNKLLSKKEKGSYEYKRAIFLKKYLDQADALLDIHASTTKQSQPFIICESNAKDIIKYLPFNLIVSGFDNAEPGGTDYYMNAKNKIGICIECGFLNNKKSTEIAERSIMNFLSAQGHIKKPKKVYKQSYANINYLYKTNTNNFKLSKEFKDFENIQKNQILGTDGKKKILAKQDGIILFARNTNEKNKEAFLLGKYKKDLT